MTCWLGKAVSSLKNTLRGAFVVGVLLSTGGSVMAGISASSSADCARVEAMLPYMQDAFSKFDNLANNEKAQRVLLALAGLESSYNPATAGVYKGREVSFGLLQVNYNQHQKDVDALYTARTGQSLAGKDYEEKLAIVGPWLKQNTADATYLGMKVYSDNLARTKDELAAAQAHCGTCEIKDTYQQVAAGQDAQVMKCLGKSGEPMNVIVTSVGGKATVLKCPDLQLAEALNKANAYYSAQSMAGYYAGQEQATREVAAVLPTIKTPIANLHLAACVKVMDDFYDLIGMLFGRAEGVWNMLLSFVNRLLNVACQYVAAAINNALSAVCIPLPDMFSLPGFGGPDRKSCNGISMADIVGVTAAPPYLTSSFPQTMRQKMYKSMQKTPVSRGGRERGLGM